MLKHVITTSLGLIMIVAIALTALGKIKNRQQVSDTIPESLDGAILEAQIVVIKNFEGLQDAKLTTSGDDPEGAEVAHMHQIKLKQAIKIPVWTQPIPPGCLHKECDAKNFGKEYFAFMSYRIRTTLRLAKPCQLHFADGHNQEAYKNLTNTEFTPKQCPSQP
ncbi:hypothetical protein BGZ72_000062 [Mortierella alpina]|nr:hypothetical protein BGZ72_000062 [Mortierella alpina]